MAWGFCSISRARSARQKNISIFDLDFDGCLAIFYGAHYAVCPRQALGVLA
jgi:hypothetical protein